MTNDVDILADFNLQNLERFLGNLADDFIADREEARSAIQTGRSFNVIYTPTAFKIDFFPARSFPLGMEELERAVPLTLAGLAQEAVPFVTPEDILLAKLHWYKSGGEVSEVQWRDIQGIVRGRRATLDRNYLSQGATRLGVRALLEKAFKT
jgi:hypothetical protein